MYRASCSEPDAYVCVCHANKKKMSPRERGKKSGAENASFDYSKSDGKRILFSRNEKEYFKERTHFTLSLHEEDLEQSCGRNFLCTISNIKFFF